MDIKINKKVRIRTCRIIERQSYSYIRCFKRNWISYW